MTWTSRFVGSLSRLGASDFSRHVAVMAGGTALAQVLHLLASPMITRLYNPEAYGVLSLYSSLLSISLAVVSLKYEMAIPVASDDEKASNVLTLSFVVMLAVVALGAASILAFGDTLLQSENYALFREYLWFLPIGLLVAGSYQIVTFWATRQQEFAVLAKTRVYQSIGSIFVQLLGAFLGLGPLGLIAGVVVGQSAGLGMLARRTELPRVLAFRGWSYSQLKEVAVRFRRFPQYMTVSGLLNTLGLQLPVLLITSYYGAEVGGLFALGNRVIGLPLNLVGDAVAQVYFGVAPRLAREDPHALLKLFLHTAKSLLALGAIPLTLLGLLAPWLFTIVFGEHWSDAGHFVRALTLLNIVRFAATPLSRTFSILERQDLTFVLNTIRVLLTASAFWCGHYFGLTPPTVVTIYGGAMTLYYLGILIIAPYLIGARARSIMGKET